MTRWCSFFVVIFLLLAGIMPALAVEFKPAGSYNLAEKGDVRLASLEVVAGKDSSGLFDMNESSLRLLPGARISADGWILDPLSHRLRSLGSFQGKGQGENREFTGEIKYVLQDHRRVVGENLIWLLFSDGRRSYVAQAASGGGKLHVRPDSVISVVDDHCHRIVEATRSRVTMVNVEWFRLYRVNFTDGVVRPGNRFEVLQREIQPWGVDTDPDTGRVIVLQANGGAVNTIVWLGDDLKPVDTRMFYSGEIVELLLEAALPGRRLVFSKALPEEKKPRNRQYLLLDSNGGLTEIGGGGGHLLNRGFSVLGQDGYILDYTPATDEPTEVWGKVRILKADLSMKSTNRTTPGNLQAKSVTTLKGLAADAVVALRRQDGRVVALSGGELLTTEGSMTLSAGDRNTLAGFLRFSSEYDAFFGEDQRFYIYNPGMKTFFSMAVSEDGRGSKGQFLTLSPKEAPATKEVLMVHPLVDAAGDIYLEDPVNFEVHHFSPTGAEIATYRYLANLAPGKPGELFVISEVDAASNKVIQEWDGDGNYMRILRELGAADNPARISGVHVLGKDAANRVHLIYHNNGGWRFEEIDYVTQKTEVTDSFAVDLGDGYSAPRPFRLAPDGSFYLCRFRPAGDGKDFEVLKYQ